MMRCFLLVALLATISSSAFAQEETKVVKEKSNKYKNWIPDKCTDEHYADSTEDETEHRARHFDDCKEYWVNMPTDMPTLTPMPTKFPTKSPSLGPTKFPTKEPTLFPTDVPSHPPTNEPTPEPTEGPTAAPVTSEPTASPTTSAPSFSPTSSAPTVSPTTSHKPTYVELYEVILPDFLLDLTFTKQSGRNLATINNAAIEVALKYLLESAYEDKFSQFSFLDLDVDTDGITVSTGIDSPSEVVTIPFNGAIGFKSNNPNNLPTSDEVISPTLRAFLQSETKAQLGQVSPQFLETVSIQKKGSSQKIVNNNDTTVTIGKEGSTTMILTISAAIVAVASTMAALGLIFAQKKKLENEELLGNDGAASPSKSEHDGLRRMRSPFGLISTPVDGMRKYFHRLDDESISSKSHSKGYLDPSVSFVNSSFSRDEEESSLEAPSMSGLSSIYDKSTLGGESLISMDPDGVSCADMSALDEVRLGNVLDLEGSLADEGSLATRSEGGTKKSMGFAKVWYGRKMKKTGGEYSTVNTNADVDVDVESQSTSGVVAGNENAEIVQEIKSPAPSPMSTPTFPTQQAQDPVSQACPTDEEQSIIESEAERNYADDNSLLGNQSERGSFYTNKDETTPVFSMLGDRSVNSMESDSVDFNDMYKLETTSSYDEDSSSMGGSESMGFSTMSSMGGSKMED